MKHLYLFATASLLLSQLLVFSSCKKDSISTVDPAGTVNVKTTSTDPGAVYTHLSADSASTTSFYYTATGRFAQSARGYQATPAIGLENNHLYAAWVGGKKEEEPGNYIVVAESDDMGKTWKQDALILAAFNDNDRRVEPLFWKDKYGSLHLSWMSISGMWDGTSACTWNVKIKTVNNQIVTTKPVRLFNGDMCQPPIAIKDSTQMLFPVSGWGIGTGMTVAGVTYSTVATPSSLNGAFLYQTSYDPITHELLTPQKLVKIPTTMPRVFDEHTVVDLGNNSYVCLLRTGVSGYSVMKSADAGLTWGTQSLFTDAGPTTSSKVYFGKLKSGNLLLVLNSSTTRVNITAMLSKDNGKTWPYKVTIDPRSGVSYPNVIQDNEGNILVTYDYGRNPVGQIAFSKLTEQDIINGAPVSYSVINTLK